MTQEDTVMTIRGSKVVPDIQCEATVTLNGAKLAHVWLTDIMDESAEKMLKFLLDHGHMSVFEHAALTFEVECPLPIRTHLFRYRTASPTEWSHRCVDKDPRYYVPWGMIPADVTEEVEQLTKQSLDVYKKLLERGVPAGNARMFLLQAMITRFEWTIDLRNFIHVWQERTADGVQRETKEIVRTMGDLASTYFPNIGKYFNWRRQ